MTPKDYNDNFHKAHLNGSLSSANEIVPMIIDIFNPKNVLDVGCGIGTWLRIFQNNNCDIMGIDGDYVSNEDLLIEKNNFKALDLNKEFELNRKFDLVISLEVAEHIYPKNANLFIQSLCKHGEIIVFSAAIPGQEGTLHFNEQYHNYWIKIFERFGYNCYDLFRNEIWNNNKVRWWYRQNIFVFIKNGNQSIIKLDKFKLSLNSYENTYIHPELFEYKCNKAEFYKKILNNPIKILKYYLKGKKSLYGQ